MSIKKFIKNHKNGIILTAAVSALPFGFMVLGVWKAYELYKRKELYVKDDISFDDFRGFAKFVDSKSAELQELENNEDIS